MARDTSPSLSTSLPLSLHTLVSITPGPLLCHPWTSHHHHHHHPNIPAIHPQSYNMDGTLTVSPSPDTNAPPPP
ncbi:hypothetical protein E2C01_087772 [Portunus trituberculatus]|uniref:Uncharacterized protein n=1 Tax=Portunus trituberculatus TaxID=210409 RepID=A0A5B7JCJ1_PORTR|nr:hypothetical protein [Portunus trituberculatus]